MQRNRATGTIRTVLIGALALAVLIGVTSAQLALGMARSALVAEVQRAEQLAAIERAATLDERLDLVLGRIEELSTNQDLIERVVAGGPDALALALDVFSQESEVARLTARDAAGAVIATAPPGAEPVRVTREAIGRDDAGRAVLHDRVDVRDAAGRLVGSIESEILLADVSPRVLADPPYEGGVTSVMSSDGTVLAASDPSLAGQRISTPELARAVAAGDATVLEYRSLALDAERLTAMAPVGDHGMVMVVGADRAAAYAPARELSLRLGLVVGLACLAITGCVAAVGMVARRSRRLLEQRHNEATRLALTDPLTGCGNRRALALAAEDAGVRGERVALVLVDLDELKSLNDGHGHGAGDQVLCDLATVLRRSVRASDTVVRTGGDEFVVLLTPGDADVAVATMRRIEAGVALLVRPDGLPARATMGWTVGDPAQLDELIERADVDLYANKRAVKAVR